MNKIKENEEEIQMNKTKTNEKGISRITVILGAIGVVLVIILIWSTIRNNAQKQQAEKDSAQNTVKEEFVQNLSDGSKLNTSKELQKTKKVDGLEFTNIQLREINGITTLLADVTNTTKTKVNTKVVSIDILDKTGNKITTVRGVIEDLEAGAKFQMNTSVTADVANAYDFRVNG